MAFNRPHGVKADIPAAVRVLAEAGFKVQDMNFHDCANFPTPAAHRGIGNAGSMRSAIPRQSAGGIFAISSAFYEHYDSRPGNRPSEKRSSWSGVCGPLLHWGQMGRHPCSYGPGPQMRADSCGEMWRIFSKSWNWRTNWALALPLKTFGIGILRPANGIPASRMNWWSWWMHCTPPMGIAWDFEHASIMQQDQVLGPCDTLASGSKLPMFPDQYGMQADHQLPYFDRPIGRALCGSFQRSAMREILSTRPIATPKICRTP